MFIPKYWRKVEGEAAINGQPTVICAWGYSAVSEDEARQKATERLGLIVERIRAGTMQSDYGYLANPMRETVIRSYGSEEAPTAVITRNGYGALVLNTAGVMFVDVDVPPSGCLALFGSSQERRIEAALGRIRSVVEQSPDLAFRVYRTCAGLRLLATDGLHEPDADGTAALMQRLGADGQYQQLCRVQKCFRARVSPKPWRAGIDRPPVRYPEADTKVLYDRWIAHYESACAAYATCRHVIDVGSRRHVTEIEMVRDIHDDFCDVSSRKELR